MKIDLDDGEVNTILVSLKNYQDQKELDWLDSRADPDAPDMGDEELLDEARSAEWCWQKISAVQQKYYNSIADPTGEGKTNNPITASVDPFGLPTWSDT